MLCPEIGMLHTGMSLQYRNFGKLTPVLLKPLWMCICYAAFLASCSSTPNCFHLLTLSPEGLTDTSQYKVEPVCTQDSPNPSTCLQSQSQTVGVFCRPECLLCLLIECMVCYVSTIISTNDTGPFASVVQEQNYTFHTNYHWITGQVSIKVHWRKWAVFLLSKKKKNCLTPVLLQYPKWEIILFVPYCRILLSIVDGLTPNLGISLIKFSYIFC